MTIKEVSQRKGVILRFAGIVTENVKRNNENVQLFLQRDIFFSGNRVQLFSQ